MRCIPVSSGKTKMEYDVFRRNDTTDEDFARINEFYKQVLQEDKDLCNGTQKNLEAGIFINGQLHPEKEKVGDPQSIYVTNLFSSLTSFAT